MAEKKLFVLDYHDAYLPFLKGINAQEDRKAYATRTILYLTRIGTLKPIAIELSLPEGEPSKQVLTPPLDATSYWLWQLGKAHVCSSDAGGHQLVHHWYAIQLNSYPLSILTIHCGLHQEIIDFGLKENLEKLTRLIIDFIMFASQMF